MHHAVPVLLRLSWFRNRTVVQYSIVHLFCWYLWLSYQRQIRLCETDYQRPHQLYYLWIVRVPAAPILLYVSFTELLAVHEPPYQRKLCSVCRVCQWWLCFSVRLQCGMVLLFSFEAYYMISASASWLTIPMRSIEVYCLRRRTLLCERQVLHVLFNCNRAYTSLVNFSNGNPSFYGVLGCKLEL